MISIAKARFLRRMIEKAAQSLPDTDALDGVMLFEHWHAGMECVAGNRLQHVGVLYRIVQTHTAQEGWEPNKTPALFTEVPKPGEIPVWKQPTGAQDAYMTGDKVHFPTKADPVWISTVDSNVWQPGVYGWDEVST